MINPGESWLYPTLHRLETAGALEGSWKEGALGPRRRYYRITIRGLGMLAEREREWATFTRGVHLVTGGATGDG